MKTLFIIPLLFLVTGCDIFETREPETPDQSRTNYITASEPEILIQNLINSFADKDVNNYLNTFVDQSFTEKIFRFVPSSTALSRFQNIWQGWNKDAEFQYFNNVKSTVPDEMPITLSLSNQSFTFLGDSLRYTAQYFLNVPQLNSDPQIYEGSLEFSMVRDSRSVWVIYFWKDNAIEDKPSWSDLKGSAY